MVRTTSTRTRRTAPLVASGGSARRMLMLFRSRPFGPGRSGPGSLRRRIPAPRSLASCLLAPEYPHPHLGHLEPAHELSFLLEVTQRVARRARDLALVEEAAEEEDPAGLLALAAIRTDRAGLDAGRVVAHDLVEVGGVVEDHVARLGAHRHLLQRAPEVVEARVCTVELLVGQGAEQEHDDGGARGYPHPRSS